MASWARRRRDRCDGEYLVRHLGREFSAHAAASLPGAARSVYGRDVCINGCDKGRRAIGGMAVSIAAGSGGPYTLAVAQDIEQHARFHEHVPLGAGQRHCPGRPGHGWSGLDRDPIGGSCPCARSPTPWLEFPPNVSARALRLRGFRPNSCRSLPHSMPCWLAWTIPSGGSLSSLPISRTNCAPPSPTS